MTMSDLLADLIGQRVCVWFQGRLAVGVCLGFADGLVGVDVAAPDGATVRTFISMAAVTAIRTMASPQD
ncbi:MAG: hypothetical protein R3C14_28795 [Caldilineaceae bacterium]